MRRLIGLVVLAALTLALPQASAQQGETRIALIIANEAYVSQSLGRLPGTQRDASLMQSALRQAGFRVIVRRDLTRAQMRTELSVFERQLADAGPQGVGFLYYSGHGIADSRRGANYLIPVDAQIERLTDLPTWGLLLNDELDAIEAAGAKATFIVIDACRNTPVSFGRSGERGLVATPAATRTLIAFSTQPGATAADDNVYARYLAEAISMPGADSSTAFPHVQSNVAQATGERQVPRFDSGLVQPILFVPRDAPAASGLGAGWVGVSFQEINDVLARSLGLPDLRGVLVGDVAPGGPAANAGVRRGDVIQSINGQAVSASLDVVSGVSETRIGQSARLGVLRDGTQQVLAVPVAERPSGPLQTRPALSFSLGEYRGEASSLGLNTAPLSAADRARYSLQSGLLVLSANGWEGFVILEAGGRPVSTNADLEAAAISARALQRPLLLYVATPSGDSGFYAFELATQNAQ